MNMQSTRGFSLLEITMATALFAVAMAVVFEAVVATNNLVSHGAAVDRIDEDAHTALKRISTDLTASGWMFADLPDNVSPGTTQYHDVTPTADRGLRYYPYVQLQDSPGSRLPWTVLATAPLSIHDDYLAGNLRSLPNFHTTSTQLDNSFSRSTSPILTDTEWEGSFLAQSQILVFVRTQIGNWVQTTDPSDARNQSIYYGKTALEYAMQRPSWNPPPVLDFSTTSSGGIAQTLDWQTAGNHDVLGVMFPTGFEYDAGTSSWSQRYADGRYGVVLEAGWFDPTDATLPIKPLWESMNLPSQWINPMVLATTAATATPVQDLREYMYAVVPSSDSGSLGRLVRAYRVSSVAGIDPDIIPIGTDIGQRITEVAVDPGPTAGPASAVVVKTTMIVDEILAEHVVRAVFDTYRSVDFGSASISTLGLNQVRVRLFLAKRQVTNPKVVLYRIAETSVAMRGLSSTTDMNTISTTLGTVPVGIDR